MSRIKRHKIKSLRHSKQKNKRMSKQTFITILIGSLMVLSVFGIMFSGYNSGEASDEYNDHKFKRMPLGWYTEVDGQRVEFKYLPQELEVLDMSQDVIDRVKAARVMYLTFDPNSKIVSSLELARFELAKSLAMSFGIQTIPGIVEESDQYDLPVVGCENATAMLPVLVFTEANRTDAYISDNCIVIETDDHSAVAMKDRLIYGMLDIIPQGTGSAEERSEYPVSEEPIIEDPVPDARASEEPAPEGWETESWD